MNANETTTLFIVTAPSGTGKTTLLKRLLGDLPNLAFSVSHTTRPPRKGEVHGEDYFFSSVEAFESYQHEGGFLEWARVHGNYYGTSYSAVSDQLNAGTDVVLDIDINGAEQVREKTPDAVSIFILPPSIESLRERLMIRNKDSIEVIEQRLANARTELEKATQFNYILINDDLEKCYQNLKSIFVATRLKKTRPLKKIQRLIENKS